MLMLKSEPGSSIQTDFGHLGYVRSGDECELFFVRSASESSGVLSWC
jgi:hypothetical protein